MSALDHKCPKQFAWHGHHELVFGTGPNGELHHDFACKLCGMKFLPEPDLRAELARSQEREARLREALEECADALEEEVRGTHGVADDSKLQEMHSVSVRRFTRDMGAVHDARRVLASAGGEK